MATFKEALTTSLTNFAKSIAKTYPKTANIVDNLLSTDSTLPLSAKQGNVLQKQIDTLNSNLFANRCYVESVKTPISGWYRVCCIPYVSAKKSSSIPYLISFGSGYYVNTPAFAMVLVSDCYNYGFLDKIAAHNMNDNYFNIDKVRLAGNQRVKYFDIHIKNSQDNYCSFLVTSPQIEWVLDYVEDADAGTVYTEINLFS